MLWCLIRSIGKGVFKCANFWARLFSPIIHGVNERISKRRFPSFATVQPRGVVLACIELMVALGVLQVSKCRQYGNVNSLNATAGVYLLELRNENTHRNRTRMGAFTNILLLRHSICCHYAVTQGRCVRSHFMFFPYSTRQRQQCCHERWIELCRVTYLGAITYKGFVQCAALSTVTVAQ